MCKGWRPCPKGPHEPQRQHLVTNAAWVELSFPPAPSLGRDWSTMGNPIGRELFLERAHSRFGDKYDYSAIVYKSYKSPVKIKCRVHPVKEISITPEKHLQTTGGCKFCLREMRITMLER